ncbi:MAG: hypothetical protein KJ995_08395, partial [Candidatus Omnitrophica bacterium]|nr:hypothetical protein [Candidatus Omnitrophota bacterium]
TNTGTIDSTAATSAINIAGNWDNSSGTFTAGTSTVTFDKTTGAQTINAGASSFYDLRHTQAGTVQLLTNNLDVTNLFTNSDGIFDANGLTNTVTGLSVISGGEYQAKTATQTFNGGLTVSGGTFTGSAGAVDVNGDVTLSSGIITAPSTGAFTVSGNWTKTAGTFTHNSGTVTFDGAALQTITSASGVYNNLTITNASSNGVAFADAFTTANLTCNTASAKLTFNAGSTYTITDTLTLNGQATGTRITLVSDATGTRFNLDVTGGVQDVYYVDVTDSEASTNDIFAYGSVSTSNNDDTELSPHWKFGVLISGTVYSDRGTTLIGAGKTIVLIVNGTAQSSNATDDSSNYILIATNLFPDDTLLIYIDGDAIDGNTVTITPLREDITGLDIYGTTVIARHETTNPITNATFNTAKGALIDDDIIYGLDVSGNDLTLDPGTGLLVWQGDTYTPGGALDCDDVIIQTGSTYNAQANTINVSGDWTNQGTFAAGTSTVTFDKTTGTQTIDAGASSFYNLQHTQAGTVQLLTNNLTVTGAFTNSAGAFDANALTNTVTGLTTVSGGEYQTSTAAQTFNGGLTISGGTFTGGAGDVDVNGNVLLSSGTLTAPSAGAFTVSGNFANTGGVFADSSGIVTFDGASTQTLNSGGAGVNNDFYDITVSGSAVNLITNPVTINNTLTIAASKTADLNGQDITLTTLDNSGTLRFQGGETVTITTMDTDSGTVE